MRKIFTNDETKNLNKYGLLKLDYLKKNNKVLYQRLIIEGKLNTFLFSVGKEAEEKVKSLINELAEKDKDLNENLKEKNQLLWVQKMNNYKNIAEEIVGDELTAFCAEGYTGEFFILGVCDRLYDETRCMQQTADRLVLMLNQYLDLHVSIGISRGIYTIQGIFQACKSARLASKMAIWEQKDCLFAEQAKISITESSMAYIPQLNQAIQTSNCELFKRVMQGMKTFICVQNHSLEEQKNLSSELLMNLQESIRKSGWKKDLSAVMEDKRFQELKEVSSSQKLSDWLDVLIATVCNGMKETAKRENRKESIMAQDYIEQHFAENITLSALAEHLNLTPGYLSTLMKRDLGMTFSEYVLHVRMEHARRLLALKHDKTPSSTGGK